MAAQIQTKLPVAAGRPSIEVTQPLPRKNQTAAEAQTTNRGHSRRRSWRTEFTARTQLKKQAARKHIPQIGIARLGRVGVH